MVISETQNTDLTICDQEPIHIPGQIQSHGIMVVLSGDDYIIEQISSNTASLIGQDTTELIGMSIQTLLGDAFEQFQLHHTQLSSADSQSFGFMRKDQFYQAILHRNLQGRLILEIEPEHLPDSMDTYTIYNNLDKSINALENSDSLQDLYDKTVREVRQMTGFDRVTLYRFDTDWHGWVVAEDKADHMPSYLGLHFPATDIPQQARALYVRNRMRLIADINSSPVGIYHQPDDTDPIDMSYWIHFYIIRVLDDLNSPLK